VSVRGVGIDLVAVRRMERALGRPRFVERVFHPLERIEAESARRRAEWYAGRFAAKEACLKALGLGLTVGRLRDVVVERQAGGAPALSLHGEPAQRLAALGATSAHLAITHDGGMAAAVVVIDG
jgi:holo-[acyl-carrier protein] synthase